MGPAIRNRRAFIDRFASSAAADERVAAVFLSGSYAAGSADAFSDVDLLLVSMEGAYDRFFEGRWQFMAKLGELVLSEDFDGFGRDMLLYLYADGVDGEVDLHHRHRVSWADPSALVAVVDKDNVAGDIAPWPTPAAGDRRRRIERLLRRFWRHVWLGSGAVARGQLFTAHAYLDDARVCCVNLARLRDDLLSPWSLSGYDKAEEILTPAEQAALAPTFGALEPRGLVKGLAALVGFFEPLARELATRHELTAPTGLAEVVRGRLDEVAAR